MALRKNAQEKSNARKEARKNEPERTYLVDSEYFTAYYWTNEHGHIRYHSHSDDGIASDLVFISEAIIKSWWDNSANDTDISDLMANGLADRVSMDGQYYIPIPSM